MNKIIRWGKWALVGMTTVLLVACGGSEEKETASVEQKVDTIHWKMVTTWPKNAPGMGTGAETLAQNIKEMSNGRLDIKVYAAGELVPALEVFDAVSRGTAQMGHGTAYYWKGKIPAAQFFSTVPFGFNAQEFNAWVGEGGGLALWEEIYDPFNLIPMVAGNAGVQMGGWFNKEINSLADFQGLKIRMPGLGGEVLEKVGASSINLPASEVFTARNNAALQTLVNEHNVILKPFPEDLLIALKKASSETLEALAANDPQSQKVYDSFKSFLGPVSEWHDVSERAYINARALE